jgi:hypothetical protein
MSPPSSGLKSKPSKEKREAGSRQSKCLSGNMGSYRNRSQSHIATDGQSVCLSW